MPRVTNTCHKTLEHGLAPTLYRPITLYSSFNKGFGLYSTLRYGISKDLQAALE